MKTLQEKIEYLRSYDGRPLRLMEVCGTHTAGIFKSGIRSFLSPEIRLISGPGCPVCVTPAAYIDRCIEYAQRPDHVLVSFGDMLKVPGSARATQGSAQTHGERTTHSNDYAKPGRSLSDMRAEGARVEMIYSPFEIPARAEAAPNQTFVIAAVGFETTAPAYGLLMEALMERGLRNVKLLTALKRAIPAIEWICENEPAVDGFLCPGHVSVVTGDAVYLPLAQKYEKPFVVAGFEGAHLVHAIYELVQAAQAAQSLVANQYSEAVAADGNPRARAVIDSYFENTHANWRGLGVIPNSGLRLKPQFAAFDAGSDDLAAHETLSEGCRCADVITGRIDPLECPLFGKLCRPGNAIGPCMVSAEGACGIWHRNSVNSVQM